MEALFNEKMVWLPTNTLAKILSFIGRSKSMEVVRNIYLLSFW
jgi:hypothetical protein